MEENRSVLRHWALSRRGSLSPANCREWSRLAQARAVKLPQYLTADFVVLYSPVQNEVETEVLRDQGLVEGKKVFYPKLAEQDAPVFVRIYSHADLLPGQFGIPEPVGPASLLPADCDRLAVFIPGVLFDHHGYRLGRGGGWYDRALSRLGNRGVFVGLAYEIQIVESLPTESWDQKVQYIITEDRVIDCGKKP